MELTKGNKHVNVLREKFIGSGEEIFYSFEKNGLKISNLRCVLIGKLKNCEKHDMGLNKSFCILNILVNGQNP